MAGAGAIAVVHSLAAPAAGLRISAVASRGGSSARHLAGNLDTRKVALDALPAGAEFLIVATPPDSHEKFVSQGLAAGATVLVEKPLTTTLASADRLVELAQRTDPARVRVAENLLHSPYWLIAKSKADASGPPSHLSARIVQPPPQWGHFLEPLVSGGVLFDLGPHPIALVLGLAASNAVAVSAELWSERPDGADDLAVVRVRFGSGLVTEIETSWRGDSSDGAPDGNGAQWAIQAAWPDAVVRLEFSPEPSVEVNGEPIAVTLPSRPKPVVDPRLESHGYVEQLIDMARETPLHGQSMQDARHVLEVICAAYASAGLGGAEVSLPFQGDRSLTPLQYWKAG